MRRFMFFLAAAVAAMIFSAPMAAMAADKTVQAPKIEKDAKGDKAPPAATDPHWLLDLAQDEGSTETKIAGYIALFHKIKARHYLSKKDKKDVLLLYELAPPKAAKIPVVVNTRPSAKDPKTKRFKVRLIEVKATYALPMEAKTDANPGQDPQTERGVHVAAVVPLQNLHHPAQEHPHGIFRESKRHGVQGSPGNGLRPPGAHDEQLGHLLQYADKGRARSGGATQTQIGRRCGVFAPAPQKKTGRRPRAGLVCALAGIRVYNRLS